MAAADTISFARGAPSLDIVDVDGLKAAAARAFDNDPGGTTAYGTSVGYVPLREWIADKHGVDTAQVLVTNGSMQADAFLFETLVAAGRGRRRREADLRPHAAEPAQPRRRGAPGGAASATASTSPSSTRCSTAACARSSPTSSRTSRTPPATRCRCAKRRRLLELARDAGFVIFEDDPYVDIRFSGEPLPTMLSMDEAGSVVYASSFSKTVCPGIRVGYLVGPAALIARHPEARDEHVHLAEHGRPVDRLRVLRVRARSTARSRRSRPRSPSACGLLTAALARELPEARYQAPEGGYFMWVELPEEIDVDRVFAEAQDRGVLFVKGTDFLLEGGRNTLRLAYSGVTADQIDEGVRRLAGAVRAVEASAAA